MVWSAVWSDMSQLSVKPNQLNLEILFLWLSLASLLLFINVAYPPPPLTHTHTHTHTHASHSVVLYAGVAVIAISGVHWLSIHVKFMFIQW